MKILTIYTLRKAEEFSKEYLERLKENTKVTGVAVFTVDNQLEGVQYPYITVDYYEEPIRRKERITEDSKNLFKSDGNGGLV